MQYLKWFNNDVACTDIILRKNDSKGNWVKIIEQLNVQES